MKYTREIAEEVLRDSNKYHDEFEGLHLPDREFLDSKFPKKLPEKGLLVHDDGSLIFRTGKESGYGFDSDVPFMNSTWSFITFPEKWKPATAEDSESFKTLVLSELKSRGIEEGTEFKSLMIDEKYIFKHGEMNLFSDRISIRGLYVYRDNQWIEPIKKDILEDVVSALESSLKKGYIIESKDGVVTIKSI